MQSRDKDQSDDPKLTVSRGPNYPFIDLERAIERMLIVVEKGGARQKMPPETFYKLWGLGAKSSNSRQTLAALNSYNLVEYVGKGTDRKAQITELGLRIALDKRPNSAEKDMAIREAALAPSIFRDLYEKYGPLMPDDVVIETFLTLERQFNDEGAKAVLRHFKETVSFASLDQPDLLPKGGPTEVSQIDVRFSKPDLGDFVDWEVDGIIKNAAPLKVVGFSADSDWLFVDGSQTGIPVSQVILNEKQNPNSVPSVLSVTPPLNPHFKRGISLETAKPDGTLSDVDYRKETFDSDEGVITISWPSNLSVQSVDDMKSWIDLLLARVERRAKSAKPASVASVEGG
jgi:hypothetical protein